MPITEATRSAANDDCLMRATPRLCRFSIDCVRSFQRTHPDLPLDGLPCRPFRLRHKHHKPLSHRRHEHRRGPASWIAEILSHCSYRELCRLGQQRQSVLVSDGPTLALLDDSFLVDSDPAPVGVSALRVEEGQRHAAVAVQVKRSRLSHSCSFDHRRRLPPFRTAMAMALRCPTSTTSLLPRVTPVYSRFLASMV